MLDMSENEIYLSRVTLPRNRPSPRARQKPARLKTVNILFLSLTRRRRPGTAAYAIVNGVRGGADLFLVLSCWSGFP
jgi:hypothetical protein